MTTVDYVHSVTHPRSRSPGCRAALAAALLLATTASCGRVIPGGDGGMEDPDASLPDGGEPDGPAACVAQRQPSWLTAQDQFELDAGGVMTLDFETRGDGMTQVSAGQIVPADEYVQCCGVRIEPSNPSAGGVIWAGNAQGGFSVRASCSGVCGLRFTFARPVLAAGALYAGSTNASVFSRAMDSSPVNTMAVSGSGTNFLGYVSDKPFEAAAYEDPAGEDVGALLVGFCPP